LPPGILARLGTTRLRHDTLWQAAFSPDGKLLVSGSPTTIRMWSTATGEMLWEKRGFGEEGKLVFAPDGNRLAVHAPGGVCFLDPATGKLLGSLGDGGQKQPGGDCGPGRRPGDAPLCFSHNGKLLLAKVSDDATRLWRLTDGAEVAKCPGPKDTYLLASAFTSDDRTVVAFYMSRFTGLNLTVCHWDTLTGALRKQFPLHLGRWRTFALSLDARTLAFVPYSTDPIRLLDTSTGQERGKLQGDRAWGLYGLAFSPDSRVLVTDCRDGWFDRVRSDENIISLWDTTNGKLLRRFTVPGLQATLHLSPGAKTLLLAQAPALRLWDTTTGRQLLRPDAHEGCVRALSFTPDGRTLVSAADDGAVRVWDAASGKSLPELRPNRWGVYDLRVLPDGRSLLSCGADGSLRLTTHADGKEVRRYVIGTPPEKLLRPEYQVESLAVSADGRTATSISGGKGERLVHIWDLATGKALASWPDTLGLTRLSPDGSLLAGSVARASGGGKSDPNEPRRLDAPGIYVYEAQTGRRLLTLSHDEEHEHLTAFSSDGRTLVTVTARRSKDQRQQDYIEYHKLHFWELASGQERLTVKVDQAGSDPYFDHLRFSADGSTLVAARGDGSLQLWDAATGKELLRQRGESPISCLRFRADGKVVATGHGDSSILLWDVAAATRLPASPRQAPATAELEACWADLANADARKAHAALQRLIDAGEAAVTLLRQRLHPAEAAPQERVQQLVTELDAKQFARRDAAARQLTEFGERADGALMAALKANPSEEVRRRIEALLARPWVVRNAQTLRSLRAVQVLEQLGTAEARHVLQTLSRGVAEARLTREARAALQRLTR
jgi:WD40 repeat protein